MYVPESGIALLVGLFAYLIATDIHLHGRVKKLEHTVRRLEGLNEQQPIKYEYEKHDVN